MGIDSFRLTRRRNTHCKRFVLIAPCLSLMFSLLSSCNEHEDNMVSPSTIHKWEYYTESHGLTSDYINTIFEDSNGNIWVGTDRGISVYTGTSFENHTLSTGLVSNNIFAITEDHRGSIWVGSQNGLNILYEGNWYFFNYFYGAAVYALVALAEEKGVLIGTGGYGIYRYDFVEQNFDLYNIIENCQDCNSINTLFQAKDQSVWISSFRGARRMKENSVTTIDAQDGLPGNIATTIAEDSWGNIWIGTFEGKTITRVSGNIVTQVSFNNGAGRNFIFGIQEDNDGNLWVGTVANGLFRYDGAIMKQVYEVPPDMTITALLKDSHGNLWIGTSGDGLVKYVSNPFY